MEETIKKYEFRALCSADIFPVFNILNKIGFKQFKACFNSTDIKTIANKNKNKEDAIEAVGMNIMFDIAGVILANIQYCENDLYKLLSSVSNLSVEEIKALTMAEFAEMIVDFVKKPEFADFFRVVSKLFK